MSSLHSTLIKRAIKILRQVNYSHPQFVLGLSLYRGALGYSIIDWSSRKTLKLGLVELYSKPTKDSEHELCQTIQIEKIDGESLGWSIAMSDGMRQSNGLTMANKIMLDRFALEQRIQGVIQVDLEKVFYTHVGIASLLEAERLIGIETKMKIDTNEKCLASVQKQIPQFPVVRNNDGITSPGTYAMSEAWIIARTLHTKLQVEFLSSDAFLNRLFEHNIQSNNHFFTRLKATIQGHINSQTDDVHDINLSLLSQSSIAKQQFLRKLINDIYKNNMMHN